MPVNLALPRLAGPILARIDGRTSIGGLHQALTATDRSLSPQAFQTQFQELYAALNGVNKLLLRRPAS
jgi:hypothetical protein